MAYDAAKPADNGVISQGPAEIRENFRALKDDQIVNAGSVGGIAPGDIVKKDGSVVMTGNLKFGNGVGLFMNTSDGTDNLTLALSGGGAGTITRGAVFNLFGNEVSPTGGCAYYYAGNVSTGDHVFYTGAGTERFRIRYDGTSAFNGSVAIHAYAADTLKVYGYSSDVSSGNDNNLNGQILLGDSSVYQGRISYGGSKAGQECVYIVNVYNHNNGGILFRTKASATPVDAMKITGDGRVLIGTTTDDGTNKLQVSGCLSCLNAYVLSLYAANTGGLSAKDTGGTYRNLISKSSGNATLIGASDGSVAINSNGTLTHNGNTIWTAASDGSGSGLDADKVQGVNLAPQEKTAQTMGAAGWFRIAQSASGINRNHGIIEIDWAASGCHGACHLAAGNHYGAAGGTGLNLLGLSFYPTGAPAGITKARIVHHATYSGNYAYLEVYADRNLSNSLAYRITQGLGWTLINATAGSIPSGYSSQEISFGSAPAYSSLSGNIGSGQALWENAGTFSWTCPPGVWEVLLTASAGGGAGGGGYFDGSLYKGGGGGGAGSAYYKFAVAVVPGTAYSVVVGAGGTGGSGSGNPGGSTSFGAVLALSGGGGGVAGSGTGNGGTAGGGDSQPGNVRQTPTTTVGYGGSGGNNLAGGVGGTCPSIYPSAGMHGGGGGGGGALSGSTQYGAAGGNGFVLIEW